MFNFLSKQTQSPDPVFTTKKELILQHQKEWMTTHQWKEGLTYEDLIEYFSNKGFVLLTLD